MSKRQRDERWTRVFNLRRALIPYILLAGERPPIGKEDGPQRFVCLSDDFDDVLHAALEREAINYAQPHLSRKKTHQRG